MNTEIEKQYVVLDVETNGLSSVRDDLLSISIYKPDDGKIFDRLLPLELNRSVFTTAINGITEKRLKKKTPLTQEEFDHIVEEYELDQRTILTYGSLDERFIRNYLKRKKIEGFQNLKFYNFKHDIVSSKYSEGNITKDNLCDLYGVQGVSEIHSGINDCILEWGLFKKMNGNKLIVINNVVYEFNMDYVVPVSYLQNYPGFKYLIKGYPSISYKAVPIKEFEIVLPSIVQFERSLRGILFEKIINGALEAEDKEEESRLFLTSNKRKLNFVGTLPSFDLFPVEIQENGQIKAVRNTDEEKVNNINDMMQLIRRELQPLIDYLRKEVFHNKRVFSHDLVINHSDNVLALCDLSSEDAILEIKSYDPDLDHVKYQLYYQANGRDIYLLKTKRNDSDNRELTFVLMKIVEDSEDKKKLRAEKLRIDQEYRRAAFEDKLGNPDISVLQYEKYGDPVILQCKKCGCKWKTSYKFILSNRNCPNCYPNSKRRYITFLSEQSEIKDLSEPSKKGNLKTRAEIYLDKLKEKSSSTISAISFAGSKERVSARCEICGFEWICRADHLLERPYCPECHKRK